VGGHRRYTSDPEITAAAADSGAEYRAASATADIARGSTTTRAPPALSVSGLAEFTEKTAARETPTRASGGIASTTASENVCAVASSRTNASSDVGPVSTAVAAAAAAAAAAATSQQQCACAHDRGSPRATLQRGGAIAQHGISAMRKWRINRAGCDGERGATRPARLTRVAKARVVRRARSRECSRRVGPASPRPRARQPRPSRPRHIPDPLSLLSST